MRTGAIIPAAALTFITSLALAPTAAQAHRFHGRPVGGHVVGRSPLAVRPFATRPFLHHPFLDHRPFVHRPFVHRPFVHRPFFRPFVPFGVVAAPVVLYTALTPYYYEAPPAYDDPPAYYPPAVYSQPATPTVAAPPPPTSPPMPSVVEYPHGRYELRGDGITTPYTWVWIPNPPPPPPPAAPEGAHPSSSSRPPARHGQLYRWIDEHGVEHWTDSGDAVPQQYRRPAKQS